MHGHKSHPWHGIDPGKDCPYIVTAFIEIVSTDTVKYEIDKESGYLKIDRPQKFSNVIPSMYGFIPKTYCDHKVALLSGIQDLQGGDKDPLDVCVLTERVITHGDILVTAIPIGGLTMIDHGEADDKIIAVLKDDVIYGKITDVSQLPHEIVDRLKHYFLTYKQLPGDNSTIYISKVYGQAHAHEVIKASIEDYNNFLIA